MFAALATFSCFKSRESIDVLDLEAAVHCLWRNDIYAEAAMGCTGPVIKLPAHSRDAARQLLTDAGYL